MTVVSICQDKSNVCKHTMQPFLAALYEIIPGRIKWQP